MIGDKWVIHWNDYMVDTYSFGSEVVFHAIDDVEYKNRLMPAGSVIKKWYSKTIYQFQRIEPTLPIIDGEGTYKLTTDIELPREEGVFVKIVFYNKYDAEVGYKIFRDKSNVFRCPLATYKYEIWLVNAGTDYLRFHSFTLQEIPNESEEQNKKDKKNTKKSKIFSRNHERADR